MKKTLPLILLLFVIAFSSCTVQKRVYRKGIYVEHKEKNPEAEKKSGVEKNSDKNSTTASSDSDSTSSHDDHSLAEDSTQTTIPYGDTIAIDTKGKNHRGYNRHEFYIGKNEKPSNVKVQQKEDCKKPQQHTSVKKEIEKVKRKTDYHHVKKHVAHGHSDNDIGWLGKWVNGLGWLSDLMLLIFCYAIKYLPMQSAGEWYFVTALLVLSLFFALLALIIAPLARKFDSRHTNLIDKGVANAKLVLGVVFILLLITGAVVGIIALFAM